MRQVVILNRSRPQSPPARARYCDTFFCQLRGLTFRRQLSLDDGLLLVQKTDSRLQAAIHMLGVWFDLAIVWINTDMRVVDVCLARSWRPIYLPRFPASYVLELSSERLNEFCVGDEVCFEEIN
jgi:uncharacterized membrane protein (UPF0127 family)